MANFSLSQSMESKNLCTVETITDTSNYADNTEGYRLSDVQSRRFTVKDLFGNILFDQSVDPLTLSVDVPITLLTLQVKFDLSVYFGAPYNAPYALENVQYIPCLGI